MDTSATMSDPADSYWRSLQYFCVYRLVAAAVFLIAFLMTKGTSSLASQDPELFLLVDSAYLAAAIVFLLTLRRGAGAFDLHLSAQVVCDVVFLSLLMYASGGAKSGIAFMLVVVVAGAALVGQGRQTLFFAALATLGVLIEQTARFLKFDAAADDFVRTGITCIGFFGIALIARFLARRVVANENLARQRGIALAGQVRINRQVIQDMDDGVLVVDPTGGVQLHNPQAELLLSVSQPSGGQLDQFWPDLATRLQRHRDESESTDILRAPNGRSLLVRLLPSGEGGNTLIYLQDLGQLQARAQQIKLAALGRLTANIAHEIRNPLSAIANAGELLVDEQRADTRARLIRIIGDNSRRLNLLVGEVLELGKRDRVQRESINLATFLGQFMEEYALHDASSAGRVGVSVGDEVICFDRAHLYRILENLVTNALRYASSVEEAVKISVTSREHDRVELHIIDDGPGIADADRSKVFEPFFTTRGSGIGLGLYIARELSDANGAHLDLIDDGQGAHFRVTARGGPCPPNPIAGIEVI
ncbi:MAG: HAMP domain-containing histidine kinase [Gammaproteobacteria bacterium]|nr:HAMP domain-containing histidine kinase [Gammaproteobacteria bacterium]